MSLSSAPTLPALDRPPTPGQTCWSLCAPGMEYYKHFHDADTDNEG